MAYNRTQLAIGILVELEHTSDAAVAEQIAKDHLREHPRYYDYLLAAEKRMKRGAAPNPKLSGHYRHASHGDRSSGAYDAKALGLESAVDAAKRLGVSVPAMIVASEEAAETPDEWHHVNLRGAPAAQVDYRSPTV